jgi:hypothetical protein
MRTVDEVQAALIEYLKAQLSLTTLLGSSTQIKETEWQGAEFTYPAVRVENTVIPNVVYCSPDTVNATIFSLSEQKSSKQCSVVATEIANLLHGKSFVATNGVHFLFIRVTKIPYPKQQEGHSIWQSPVELTGQVS